MQYSSAEIQVLSNKSNINLTLCLVWSSRVYQVHKFTYTTKTWWPVKHIVLCILLWWNLWSLFKSISFIISQVNGIKAIPSFVIITNFDLEVGFSVEWMHCVLLGVSKLLMNFWISIKCQKEKFYLENKVRFYKYNCNNWRTYFISVLLF